MCFVVRGEGVERTTTSASAEYGVSGGGLITVVHPAASAAPSLRVIMAEGKFQGVMIELSCAREPKARQRL